MGEKEKEKRERREEGERERGYKSEREREGRMGERGESNFKVSQGERLSDSN